MAEDRVSYEAGTERAAWLQREVRAILTGQTYYGTVKIETRQLGRLDPDRTRVVWVGSAGRSASAGMWIRLVNNWGGAFELPALRWAVPEGPGLEMVYYGIRCIGTEWAGDTLYLVGGCTRGSGEGGRARELVEAFLNMRGLPVEDAPAVYLIELLSGLER